MKRSRVMILLAILAFSGSLLGDQAAFDSLRLDNWHQWRGPEGTGVAPKGDPPLRWSESENVRFKVEIPGEGHASPIVWGDRVYVLSAERTDREGEAPRASDSGRKTSPPRNFYRFLVASLDRKTGETRWRRTACEEVPHEGRQETNSYASATPATDGRHLYASFGSMGIYCYDLEGNLAWKRDLGRMKTRFGWGEGASPVVHGDTLLVNWDQEGGSFIVALDVAQGETRWKIDRDEASSWTTPLVVEHGGVTQVVVNGKKRVRSYDLRTGQVVWECGGQTENPIPTPVTSGGVVFCMSGFRGSAAYAIRLDAKGDITDTDKVLWRIGKGTPYVPSPILYGERIYFTGSNGNALTGVDAKTGKAVVDGVRLPGMKTIYASPVAAAGRIYFVDRDGTAAVIRQGDGFEVLATNKLDESISATPAIAGRQMYLRGSRHLWCLEEGLKGGRTEPKESGAKGF